MFSIYDLRDKMMLVINYFENPWLRAAVILVGSLLAALVIRYIVIAVITRLTRRTTSQMDDRAIDAIKSPVFYSVLLAGVGYAVEQLSPGEAVGYVLFGLLKTIMVLMWAIAAGKISHIVLQALSVVSDRFEFIQLSTLPLFQIIAKIIVFGGAAYFAFVSWGIDVTGWLASAGIVGIAVGFAAKDTLANLFAGIFILTDAPYKPGDFIVLSGNLRGMVTQIGIRSTRILTREDVEVTIPNAVIANSQIINETSGPHEKRRLSVDVSVAYGSDIDKVRDVLLEAIAGIDNVAADPPPVVRFMLMGDSGLVFQMRVWINQPVFKGRVVDVLNTRAYKALNAAGIEIPYPKQDLYIKEMPGKPDAH